MSSQSIQVVAAKIERSIYGGSDPYAEFDWLRPSGKWFCSQAWFDADGPRLHVRSTAMTPEEAAVVSVSIQMAIDWLTEKTAERGSTPEGTKS